MTREEKISLLTDCCFKSRCGDCAIRQGKYESPVLKSGCVRLQTASDADLDKALKIIGKAGNTMTDRERELQAKYNEYFDKYHDLLAEYVQYREDVTELMNDYLPTMAESKKLIGDAKEINRKLLNEITVLHNRIRMMILNGAKEPDDTDNDIEIIAARLQNYCLNSNDCQKCVFAKKYDTEGCVLRNPDLWFEGLEIE